MTIGLGLVIILAIVQGLTEFFPISSSGHLVIFESLFGMRGQRSVHSIIFEVAVHIGTLGAVVIFYRRKLLLLSRAIFSLVCSGESGFRRYRSEIIYVGYLLLATIPAGMVGTLFHEQIEGAFDSPALTSMFLVATGVFLLMSRLRCASWGLSWHTAIIIGLAQAVAILPGISRSGWTITSALLIGFGFEEAAEFSFLLSVPAILGAMALEVVKGPPPVTAHSMAPLVVGMIGAFLAGSLALKLLIGILNRGAFHRFAYYLLPAGVTAFLYFTLFS